MKRGLLLAVLVCALAPTEGAATRHPDAVGLRGIALGRSVDGRPITAVETGDFDSPRKVLVVGCIHGNECAGTAVARRLARVAAPAETDLWVLGDLNPDGAVAGTRGNARAVDLNRNFPWRWQRLGGIYDSGPRPLSEPETRLAAALIARLHPSVSIWFHQHLDLVDDSTGAIGVERRFGAVARLRLAPLLREPGSAVTWESHCFPHTSAFVVELPSGSLAALSVGRLVRAVDVAAAAVPEARPATRCR